MNTVTLVNESCNMNNPNTHYDFFNGLCARTIEAKSKKLINKLVEECTTASNKGHYKAAIKINEYNYREYFDDIEYMDARGLPKDIHTIMKEVYNKAYNFTQFAQKHYKLPSYTSGFRAEGLQRELQFTMNFSWYY